MPSIVQLASQAMSHSPKDQPINYAILAHLRTLFRNQLLSNHGKSIASIGYLITKILYLINIILQLVLITRLIYPENSPIARLGFLLSESAFPESQIFPVAIECDLLFKQSSTLHR